MTIDEAEVENIIVKELGLASRDDLAKSGKIPAIWIATLIKCFSPEIAERKLS